MTESSQEFRLSSRWRLHRGGIVNIWEYGDRQFDFSGGRVILQGTNGSGKSRTLELQLPLCLDGDLHKLGAKGHDSVSIRRLMLDDYTGGANRIGYTWLELRRLSATGDEEYLTCGVGIKASKSTHEITNSWRFVTSERVGADFQLVTSDKHPLDMKELKDRIGSDMVFEDSDDFQVRVAKLVYGIDSSQRYGELLHLQRVLRNPDIGNRAVEGKLDEYLRQALPPLDPQVIKRLAGQFQDLDAIRENTQRLHRARAAIAAFLSGYSRYALAALQEREVRLRAASNSVQEHAAQAKSRKANLTDRTREAQEISKRKEDTERKDGLLGAQIKALESTDQYRTLLALNDRRQYVDVLHGAAREHLSAAVLSREVEKRAARMVAAALSSLSRTASLVRSRAELLVNSFEESGLDRKLIPTLPQFPTPELSTVTEVVALGITPESPSETVERIQPATFEVGPLLVAVRQVTKQLEAVKTASDHRLTVALALQAQLLRHGEFLGELTKLRVQADQAVEAVAAAALRHKSSRVALSARATEWVTAVSSWAENCPAESVSMPARPAVAPDEELLEDPGTVTKRVKMAAQSWLESGMSSVRSDRTQAEAALAALRAESLRLEEELRRLNDGASVLPPRHTYAEADRQARPGAAFYELVDFCEGLDTVSRAGLEAALQASGLLNAWIYPDGSVADPDLKDLIATAPVTLQNPSAETLASVLVAAPPLDSAVSVEKIVRLLNSIELDYDGLENKGLSVSVRGRWRSGGLQGAWTKERAEFVGAATRESNRTRRIDELIKALEEAAEDLLACESTYARHHERLADLERHAGEFPNSDSLIAARAHVAEAEANHSSLDAKAKEKLDAHEHACARWEAERMNLQRAAAGAGLPIQMDGLTTFVAALKRSSELSGEISAFLDGQLIALIADLTPVSNDYVSARRERADAELLAAQKIRKYLEELESLQVLVAALGADAETLDARLSQLRNEQESIRGALPQLVREKEAIDKAVAKLEAAVENDAVTHVRLLEELSTAELNFDNLASAPGFGLAAVGQELPNSRQLAQQVIRGRQEVAYDKAQIVGLMSDLQSELPEDHHGSFESVGDALAVFVSDGDARRPVALAVHRVQERIKEDEAHLNTRYQEIFQKFLLHDLAEHIRQQIDISDSLCHRMNEILAKAESSQGVVVQIEWTPSIKLDADTRDVVSLIKKSLIARSGDEDERLRRVLQRRIESERDRQNVHYAEMLPSALDYREWYDFAIMVRDVGPDGRPRSRRLSQLSSGESRLISYVILFAAAAAFYDALGNPNFCPMRLILLDEAFQRLDEPTITRLLVLLNELDMDWIITWPGGAVFSPEIERMHVYDVFRPKGAPGMAFFHTVWDGFEEIPGHP